jgi:putative OPT family oligopeptide transporter
MTDETPEIPVAIVAGNHPQRELPDDQEIAGIIPKPPGTPEFTIRAVIAGMVVAAVMGASYPYIVLKLGFGPNVSVVAAFFGYLSLGLLFRNFNRWENNIVQTAGTSAAQTAFMCVILAAFDLLRQNPVLHYTFAPTPLQSFLWLAVASVLGLLMAVPLRRHYVVDEKLKYADGFAAAQTIVVLDGRGRDARIPAMLLAGGVVASGLVFFLQSHWGKEVIPETVLPTMLGLTFASAGAGFSTSLLSLGSGMIVGLRVTLSMAIGGVLAWVIAPHFLVEHHIIPAILRDGVIVDAKRSEVLRWVMWPGTAMIICAGLTALALKWKTLARTFKDLSTGPADHEEFPLPWVIGGVAAATVLLVIVQVSIFDLPLWAPVVSVVLSLPLMLVGLRVLGETNWGPISQLTNLMQVIFSALLPHSLTANLATSGTTGTIAVQSEAIMQDYKAGHLIGSTPRYLTYSQLIAAPIGAAAVAWMYPLLRDTYGIGGDGLSSPISIRVATFATFLSRGESALLRYAGAAAAIFAVLGIAITLLEGTKWRRFLPSATAVGIGMVVPGSVVFGMLIGGVILYFWERRNPKAATLFAPPLASGLIAGEALVAVLITLLIASKVLSLPGPEAAPAAAPPAAATAPSPPAQPAPTPAAEQPAPGTR